MSFVSILIVSTRNFLLIYSHIVFMQRDKAHVLLSIVYKQGPLQPNRLPNRMSGATSSRRLVRDYQMTD